MSRILIKPCGIGCHFATNGDGIVGGRPFPFTKCHARRLREIVLELHIFQRNIVNRKMACFQNAFRPLRLRNHHSIENDFKMFLALFKPGRTWIIPNGFLSRLNTFFVIHSKRPFPFQNVTVSLIMTSLTDNQVTKWTFQAERSILCHQSQRSTISYIPQGYRPFTFTTELKETSA